MESSLYFTEPFCWVILEAADSWISFVPKVCGHVMKRLSSWRWLFFLNDYNNMAVSFVTNLNFWRRKLYNIGLDSFLYLSWFTATINTTVCLSRLFSTDLERHQYELDPVNAFFFFNPLKTIEFWQLKVIWIMSVRMLTSWHSPFNLETDAKALYYT